MERESSEGRCTANLFSDNTIPPKGGQKVRLHHKGACIHHTHNGCTSNIQSHSHPKPHINQFVSMMDKQLPQEHSQNLLMPYWCLLFSAAVRQTIAHYFLFSSSLILFHLIFPSPSNISRTSDTLMLNISHCLWLLLDEMMNSRCSVCPVVKVKGVIKTIFRSE